MILSKGEILKAVKKGRIRINPFNINNVGACSVDLRLGYEFKQFVKSKSVVSIDPSFKELEDKCWKRLYLKRGNYITIKPREFVLGNTLERIKICNSLCAFIDGRSRFARAGLLVHASSSLIQPGVNNVQVLEIINMSSNTINLFPETKICQVIFQELKGSAEYKGMFKTQLHP